MAPVLGEQVKSNFSELTVEVQANSQTGEVVLTPRRVSEQSFKGGKASAYITAHWDGHPDQCSYVSLPFTIAGNLWAADPDRKQIVVLDSGGQQVGGGLEATGVDQPRLVASIGSGEMLVGGVTAQGTTAMVVFDNRCFPKRTIGGTEGIGSPLRAATGLGAFTFVSGGTLSEGVSVGALYVINGSDGLPEWKDATTNGLASDGTTVFLGQNNNGSYKRVDSALRFTDLANVAYKDSSPKAENCNVQATTAIVHLAEGGFVIASRHAQQPGAATDGHPYGHLAWTNSQMGMQRSLQHRHSSMPGTLSPSADGPYDWMEEVKPGVIVGTRDGKPGIRAV
ncbi:MAG: hypothetical protein QM765_19835 [Myxococcales bacterium]